MQVTGICNNAAICKMPWAGETGVLGGPSPSSSPEVEEKGDLQRLTVDNVARNAAAVRPKSELYSRSEAA